MIRLRNAHRGERAAVVFGGPSLIATGFDFGGLRNRGFVTFLETKALTPRFLQAGAPPDYFLMFFPEKAKDNGLQHWVYRSLLTGHRLDWLLKPAFRATALEIRRRFDEYFEPWRPHRGVHKRFRWRPSVYLRDSPYELLQQAPESRIIVNRSLVAHYFPQFGYGDRAFYFDQTPEEPTFDLDKYFNPLERDGMVILRCANTFMNSAAIALYPVLHYMGFKEAYFLGMDMSILGSLEYAAPYTFRSMVHFWWFLHRNERAFPGYRANAMFRRPQSEFDNIRTIWNGAPMAFTRVYDPWRYAAPIDGIRTISVDEFLKV